MAINKIVRSLQFEPEVFRQLGELAERVQLSRSVLLVEAFKHEDRIDCAALAVRIKAENVD